MTRLLYCSIKEIYQADGNYYTTGSWPEIIPSLADYFDETYLMVSVLTPTSSELMKLSKFKHSEKLKIVQARDAPLRWDLPLWSLANLNLFRNLQKKAHVTLMAIPSSIPYLAYLPLNNKPLIAYVAGDEQEVLKASNPSFLVRTGYSRAAKLAEKYLLKKSDAIICPNSRLKAKLVAKYHLLESEVHVIAPPGVRADFFEPLGSKQKAEIKSRLKMANNLVIGFVTGAISVAKGGDIIIKVFHEIKRNIPNAKLLLIGEDRIGIPKDDSIIHLGFIRRKELPRYYNIMDLFICCSLSETGPKVVMEAAACGIPVISSDVGCAIDLINKGGGGFIIEKRDISAMINCCRTLLEDENLRTEMGRKAREYAVKNFDSDKLVKKTAEAIKSVVRRK